eukprot:m.1295448 g.1295448  ORF g.1295448 m.1295448 type:complete len:134 (-) comp24790_c0_seq1:210-611(-)
MALGSKGDRGSGDVADDASDTIGDSGGDIDSADTSLEFPEKSDGAPSRCSTERRAKSASLGSYDDARRDERSRLRADTRCILNPTYQHGEQCISYFVYIVVSCSIIKCCTTPLISREVFTQRTSVKEYMMVIS